MLDPAQEVLWQFGRCCSVGKVHHSSRSWKGAKFSSIKTCLSFVEQKVLYSLCPTCGGGWHKTDRRERERRKHRDRTRGRGEEEKERGENTEIELETEGRKRSEVGRGINQEPRKVRMCLCASEFLVTLRYLSTEDTI